MNYADPLDLAFTWHFHGHEVRLWHIQLGEASARLRVNFGCGCHQRRVPFGLVPSLQLDDPNPDQLQSELKTVAFVVWASEYMAAAEALEEAFEEFEGDPEGVIARDWPRTEHDR